MFFPSIGLAELFILAGVAGLSLLAVAVIVVAVVRRRKRDGTRPWKWAGIFGLILVALPLVAVVLAREQPEAEERQLTLALPQAP